VVKKTREGGDGGTPYKESKGRCRNTRGREALVSESICVKRGGTAEREGGRERVGYRKGKKLPEVVRASVQ